MAEKSKLWYLENFNLLAGLGKENLKKLSEITTMQNISKNQPIYFAKEPSSSIFFLKEGRVKITKNSPEGKELIIAIVNPGEIFGEMSILDEGERTDFAITMDKSLICAISRQDFKFFIDKNPELNIRINKLIGFKLRKFSERIEDLVFKDADQRILSFLSALAEQGGKKIGDELIVKPFLTHQNIAELTACSRQTVNYLLTDLRDKEIIYFDRRKLIIKDTAAFKALIKN